MNVWHLSKESHLNQKAGQRVARMRFRYLPNYQVLEVIQNRSAFVRKSSNDLWSCHADIEPEIEFAELGFYSFALYRRDLDQFSPCFE